MEDKEVQLEQNLEELKINVDDQDLLLAQQNLQNPAVFSLDAEQNGPPATTTVINLYRYKGNFSKCAAIQIVIDFFEEP